MLVGAFIVQIIAYDAWHVITPDIVMRRWIATGLLLVVSAVVWYLSHNPANSLTSYKRLIFLLISADIAMASFQVYSQRGMASRAVLLFTIPIVISAILLSRSAIFATAILATAAYSITTICYFVLNFNEGYKTELYGEVGFYCAAFFVLAAMLSTIIRFGGNAHDS